MSTEGVIIVGEPTSGSAPPSAPGSPKSGSGGRVKFLCSHGGKILPRPADSHLKYVGGETRVISVPRDITFQELMKKLTRLSDGEMVLKYQLVPEDIDILVTVKSDEDLRHMFEEHDNYEKSGSPRLRAFLFPANPVIVDNASTEPHPLEHRYIDAINGIVRAPTIGMKRHPTINVNLGPSRFSSASACTSPRSPDSSMTENVNHETVLPNNPLVRARMIKVHSSPSLCSLDGPQAVSPKAHQSSHPFHQHYRQPLIHNFQYSKPPIDPHRGGPPERPISVYSVGKAEGVKYQGDHVPQHYNTSTRHYRGSGVYTKSMHYDDYGSYSNRRRPGSLPMTPVLLSPRHGHGSAKGWDAAMADDN